MVTVERYGPQWEGRGGGEMWDPDRASQGSVGRDPVSSGGPEECGYRCECRCGCGSGSGSAVRAGAVQVRLSV